MNTTTPRVRGTLYLRGEGHVFQPSLGIRIERCPHCGRSHEHRWPLASCSDSSAVHQVAGCQTPSMKGAVRFYEMVLDPTTASASQDALDDFRLAMARWKLAQKKRGLR